MFCSKCGTRVPDGSKFCPGCGAPLPGQPAQAAVPQRPDGFQATPAEGSQPSAGPQPPKKSKAPIIVCAVVAVVAIAAVAVFALMPKGGGADSNGVAPAGDAPASTEAVEQGTPWTSMDLSGNGYTHEFSIALDEPDGTLGPVTIYDQDEMVTAEISGNSGGDENLLMCQDDTVDWGSWGPDSFRNADSGSDKECTLLVPGDATVENPWGRWAFIATCDDYSSGDQYLFTRSTTLELNEDGTGSYEFAAMWGDYVTCEVADPSDENYDPSKADNSFVHSFTWERSGNTFDITFDNGNTYTLTFE